MVPWPFTREGYPPIERYGEGLLEVGEDPQFRMCLARLINHYWRPAAWRLARRWPAAHLHVVPGVGRAAGGVMAELGVDALDRSGALD